MEYLRFRTELGEIVVRDVDEADLDALVAYWHEGVADHAFLGIDPERLGSPEDTRARFRAANRSVGGGGKTAAFVLAMGARVVAYTNVNFRGRDGYAHVHFIDPDTRNRGVASSLVPSILGMFFEHLPIDRLVLEARTRNTGINRVLEKSGLKPAWTGHLEKPDGLAGPGEFHVYHVDPPLVAALLARGT
jgi:RimJ/RimL family protein N-acetyltransferase